jgi:hypothetical protein
MHDASDSVKLFICLSLDPIKTLTEPEQFSQGSVVDRNTMSERQNRSQKRTRIRKRPVSFGNPALGTYPGNVYTFQRERHDAKRPLFEGAADVRRLVAMVDVPAEQVPEGILNGFERRSFLSDDFGRRSVSSDVFGRRSVLSDLAR